MSTTVDDMVALLGRRIRDPDNLAHSYADKRTIISLAQQVVGAASNASISRLATTYVPSAFPVYNFEPDKLVRILGVTVEGKELDHVPWRSLANHNPRWLSVHGRPRVWDMIGRQYVLIWPQPLESIAITLVATHLAKELTGTTETLELHDEYMPGILTLAEQLLLLRQRLFVSIVPAAERGKADIFSGRATS